MYQQQHFSGVWRLAKRCICSHYSLIIQVPYYAHFIDEGIEAYKSLSNLFKLRYQSRKWQSPPSNSVLSNSQGCVVHHHYAMLPSKQMDGQLDYYRISFRTESLGFNIFGAHFHVWYSSLSWVTFSLLLTSKGKVRHPLSNTSEEVLIASSFICT